MREDWWWRGGGGERLVWGGVYVLRSLETKVDLQRKKVKKMDAVFVIVEL